MKIITHPPYLIRKYMDLMDFTGLTMPFTHTIYFRRPEDMTDWLLRHEKKHVEQMEREGDVLFLIKYNWYWITKSYKFNPYEIEARKAEKG